MAGTGRQGLSVCLAVLALVIGDAVLTVILGKAAMYTDRREFWAATEKAHRPALDPSGDGLARRYSLPLDPPVPRNACLVTKVPVLRCFNVLRSELYDRWIEDPAWLRSCKARTGSGSPHRPHRCRETRRRWIA